MCDASALTEGKFVKLLVLFFLFGLMSIFPSRAMAGISCDGFWSHATFGGVSMGAPEWQSLGCTYTGNSGADPTRGSEGGVGGGGGMNNRLFMRKEPLIAGLKNLTCGNPVIMATGNKVEDEVDFASAGEAALGLSREYNKYWDGVGVFGKQWVSNYDYKLSFGTPNVDACYPRPGGGICGIGANSIIYAHRPGASAIKFLRQTDGTFLEEKATPVAKIVPQADGSFILYSDDRDVEHYSSAGYVSDIKNEHGVGWTYSYSGTYPTRVTHTNGRYIDFVWTGSQLTAVRDPAGNYYGYAYLANRFGAGLHLLSATTKPGTPVTSITYHYEDSRFLGGLTGKSFNNVRYSWFAYDAFGRATSTEHTGGRDRQTFVYNIGEPNEILVDHTNPLGHRSSYSVVNGRLQYEGFSASGYCAAAGRLVTFDANGNDDIVRDFNGNQTNYDYNAKGQLLKTVEAFGKPEARTTDYVWDTTINRILSITVLGVQSTAYTFTPENRLQTITLTNLSAFGVPNETRTTTYSYTKHANGMLATYTVDGPIAGAGDAITQTFNALGDLISVSNSLGHQTTYSGHNGLGQPTHVVGINGDVIDYTYDAQGRITNVRTYPNGIAANTSYAFSGAGLLAAMTTADGVVNNYEYDTSRTLTRTWRTANGTVAGGASQEEQLFTYNLNSDITKVEYRKIVGHYETQCLEWRQTQEGPECWQEGEVWVTVPTVTQSAFTDYDELGRIRARRGNGGQNNRYTYDFNGNIKTIKDSADRLSTMDYDALNRVIKATDRLNGITEFKYDAGDQLTWIKDPRSLITTFSIDGFGQLRQQLSPDTGNVMFQYDAAGLRTSLQRTSGSSIVYGYDGLGRLTSATDTLGDVRSYSYDWCSSGKGQLCGVGQNNGTWSHFAYTGQGQLWQKLDVVNGSQDLTAYAYDNMGHITGISYPSGVAVGYGYANGKLTTMTATSGGTTVPVVSYVNYLPYGGISSWTYGNGLNRGYNYDLDGRRTGISTSTAGSVLQSLTFGYNADDEITAITNGVDAAQSHAFQYDALSRLTKDTIGGGSSVLDDTFDAIGNRINRVRTDAGSPSSSTQYQISATSGQMTGTTGSLVRTLNYDSAGQVGSSSGWGGSRSYGYDAFQRLKSITIGGATTNYQVNALDQRAGKSGAGGTYRFVYAGQNQMLAEYGPTGWKSYIWLGRELVGVVQANNVLSYVHSDHLGRPELVTYSNQVPVWRASNGSYNRSVTLDLIGGLNIGLPGQYYDGESGTWYNGFRDYDPSIGRYLQADPVGLAGGLNSYAYVEGNPVNAVDLFGLDTLVMVGGETSDNPFGHVAIAFTGQGVFSYGTTQALGSSTTAYLTSQSKYRTTTLFRIKTTPAQERRMLAKILKFRGKALPDPRKDWRGALSDTCATRTQASLAAGGIKSSLVPISSPLPSDTGMIALSNSSDISIIWMGGGVPSDLSSFNP